MFQISQDFAPPFKLIAPYFIVGAFFYLLSAMLLFFFDISNISYTNLGVVGWVHIYLLGFVMMIIFGAMAQLVPVVLEVGHYRVSVYYVIYPLLLVGTLLMAIGFVFSSQLLPYGGSIVLLSMMIFVFETFMTLLKVKEFNFVMKSVVVSNSFLFIGTIIGIIMAFGFAGIIGVDIVSLLKAHVYLVIGGYISITIMGLSLILIPMFSLSHNFDSKPVEYALYLMSSAVISVVIASLFELNFLLGLGYLMAIISMVSYFYQTYIIFVTRARKEHDIYAKSLYVSYISLIISLVLGVIYLFGCSKPALIASAWTMFIGFFGFLIIGHLYKIVPFLVWFERFSPFVGKRKVPMLVDMIPLKSSYYQFYFSVIGTVISMFGILIESDLCFKTGASFFLMGAIFLVKNLLFMINFKE